MAFALHSLRAHSTVLELVRLLLPRVATVKILVEEVKDDVLGPDVLRRVKFDGLRFDKIVDFLEVLFTNYLLVSIDQVVVLLNQLFVLLDEFLDEFSPRILILHLLSQLNEVNVVLLLLVRVLLVDGLESVIVHDANAESFHDPELDLDFFHLLFLEVDLDGLVAQFHQDVVIHDLLLSVIGRDLKTHDQSFQEFVIRQSRLQGLFFLSILLFFPFPYEGDQGSAFLWIRILKVDKQL